MPDTTETIKGKLPDGAEQEFKITLMDTKEGLAFLHDEFAYLLAVTTLYGKTLEDVKEDERLNEGEFLSSIIQSVEGSKFNKMVDTLLGGNYNGGALCVYAGLYYAIRENFGATINPIMAALAGEESDSTETSIE